jgi:hypothetical protein
LRQPLLVAVSTALLVALRLLMFMLLHAAYVYSGAKILLIQISIKIPSVIQVERLEPLAMAVTFSE